MQPLHFSSFIRTREQRYKERWIKTTKQIRGVYEKVPGSGSWWIRYADASGHIRREKVGTKSSAIKLYRKRKNEVLDGKKLPANLRSVVRVSDLAPALLRDYRVNERKSYDSAERRLRKHVLPFFGNMAANEVGTTDFDAYIDNRRSEGAQNATINREMAALKRIYSLARGCKPPCVRDVPTFPRLKENPPRKGFMQDKEYALLQVCAEELWLKAIAAVAYTFGFRRGELLKLKVRQVDLNRRTICLDAGETKNDDARTVKMTSEVYGLLAQCVQNKQPGDYVFTRGHNEPVLNFRGAWYSLCERAGLGSFVKGEDRKLSWKGLIFHDLRRSAVRNMVRRGVPETVAMMISGHKTRSVFDRYNIVSESDIEKAAAMIERGREYTEEPTDTITSTSVINCTPEKAAATA